MKIYSPGVYNVGFRVSGTTTYFLDDEVSLERLIGESIVRPIGESIIFSSSRLSKESTVYILAQESRFQGLGYRV